MRILLHPTHRKLIKILREHIDQGKSIIISDRDIDDYKELMAKTMSKIERHRGVYRILLQAMHRTESHPGGHLIGHAEVNIIEEALRKAEKGDMIAILIRLILCGIISRSLKRHLATDNQ